MEKAIAARAVLAALLLVAAVLGAIPAGAVAAGEPPLVSLEVRTNGEDADAPPGPAIPVGGAVTWTYVVTNTGGGPACYVQVTDDRIGPIPDPEDMLLGYGETRVLTATGTAVPGQYGNNATVEAWVPADSRETTASDPSHYYGVVPPPVPPSALVPTDTDRDGRYEDVNGNGRKDFADVVLFFNQMSWIAGNEPVAAFDYGGNGRIDFADAVWLFDHLSSPGGTFTVTAVAVGPGRIAPAGANEVPAGGNITFTLGAESALPTPHDTQSGYLVANRVLLDPAVVPTPYPPGAYGPPSGFTRSYTLQNVRADHAVYGVFHYYMMIC